MRNFSVVFFIIALIAGILGFAVLSGVSATITQIVFLILVALFLITLLRAKRA